MAYLLIIDDDKDFAEVAKKVLEAEGHEVSIELDLKRGAESMSQRHPDLVILDVMFPENASGGFEMARTIKHYDASLKGIPVLMLTAVNTRFPLGFSSRDIDDTWLPVEDFLEKPVDFDTMLGKVTRLLEKKAE